VRSPTGEQYQVSSNVMWNLSDSGLAGHEKPLCYARTCSFSYKNSGAKSAPLGQTTV
jgi:hypothetical protein